MSGNYSIGKDVKEALRMAEELTEYVRTDAIYGRVGIFSSMPSLTSGALVMRLRRLDALRDEMKDHHRKNLDKAIDYYAHVRTEWTHHYENKIIREAHSRIDAMKAFFYECGEHIQNCSGIYKPEIIRRTIVQEILMEMKDLNAEDEKLMQKVEATDKRLWHFTAESTFQWDPMLERIYPQEDFWWLYRCPPDLV